MKELLRTNDVVLISFIKSLFNDHEIPYMIMDENMSIMEGSLGIIQRRIMVYSEAFSQARIILKNAGLEPAEQQ
jgi:hypothetical protein